MGNWGKRPLRGPPSGHKESHKRLSIDRATLSRSAEAVTKTGGRASGLACHGAFLMVSTDLKIGISFIANGRSGKIRSLWEVLIKGGRSTSINQLRTARKCSVL